LPYFSQTFWSLLNWLPFSDPARVRLRAFAEALQTEMVAYQTECNSVFDSAFIPHASGSDLDEHGAVLDLARCPTEPDLNYGVEFFGPNTDYILIAYNASLDVTTQITIDLRLKMDAFTGTDKVYSRNNSHQEISTYAAGNIGWEPRVGVNALSAPGVIVAGNWYHVRAIYDSVTGAELYVGVPGGVLNLVGNAVAGGLMTAGAWPIRIGQRWDGTTPMDGVVDEIRVVAGVVATVDGVTEVPRCLEAVTGTQLLLHCDEGTGPTAFDTSGNGNDGALQGNADWFSMLATGWPGYRQRLLDEFQSIFAALTVQSIDDAVTAIGATFVPVITVNAVAEHYKDRLEDGVGVGNTYDLGDSWGLSSLDLLTFSVELSRIPTPVEVQAIVDEIGLVRPAHTRGFVVREMPPLVGSPQRYRLYGTSFSDIVANPLWYDNFERFYLPSYPGDVEDLYKMVNNNPAPPPDCWEYLVGNELYGDASDGFVGKPHLILPRQDLDPAILDYRDMYMEASLKITGATSNNAGLCMRYDDATGEFYYLAIRNNAGTYEYSFIYYDGAALNTIINWTGIGTAMNVYKTVQAWLENDLFTLIINGVVLENQTDIKRVGVLDITADGEWGFCTNGTAQDLWVEWFFIW
jgi:hypothetical protein